jgi:hypothetical protein
MIKPKRLYNEEEIFILLQEIEKERSSNPSGSIGVVKSALSSYVMTQESPSLYERTEDAFDGIADEAADHERKAKELRSIIHSFECPKINLPKLMNDKNPVISKIARWRMLLGR